MEAFRNRSNAGNEKAVRRGVRVPDGDVNLAWVKAPALRPDKNVIILDTSQITPENLDESLTDCKLMFADQLGVLQDVNGNQVIDDEYPAVADVFSVDEDWLALPGSEYENSDILPFVHRSRFFHIDFPGLTTGEVERTFESSIVKVVNEDNTEYLKDNGEKRYRIKLVPARSNPADFGIDTTQEAAATDGVYRVLAYVDNNKNEKLFLTYNKVELDVNGNIKNQDITHREVLNPLPYFEYQPEESDVVDPANRNKRWYSTKPVNLKEQVAGLPYADVDGYKVYVPRKAITDTRLFQLFRWRVKCEFTESFKVDPARTASTINVGFLQVPGEAFPLNAYALYNTELSDYNATGVRLQNPLSERSLKTPPKNTAKYWTVNANEVSFEDLEEFDFLLWSPHDKAFDFGPYRPLIDYFVSQVGGTMYIDLNNWVVPENLYGITTSAAWNGIAKSVRSPGPDSKIVGSTIEPTSKTHPLFDGNAALGGGWDFNDGTEDEYDTITLQKTANATPIRFYHDQAYFQHMNTLPAGWTEVLYANTPDGERKSMLAHRDFRAGERTGRLIVGTAMVSGTVNGLEDPSTGARVSWSRGPVAFSVSLDPEDQGSPELGNFGIPPNSQDEGRGYEDFLRSATSEGARKLFFNMLLWAVKGKIVDSSDEQRYTSSWSYYSDWAASWVINAADGVLSDTEILTNDFFLLPKSLNDPDPVWQRRLKLKPSDPQAPVLNVKQLVEQNMTNEEKNTVRGMTRTYTIESTNGNVQTPTILNDRSVPYAWTEVYSPKFTIPLELGPNVVFDDKVQGEYSEGQFTHFNYPPKPYELQTRADYIGTEAQTEVKTATVTVRGTALETWFTTTPIKSTVQELRWDNGGFDTTYDSTNSFEIGAPRATGVATWNQANYKGWYYGNGNLAFPHYGIEGRFGQGSRGDVVTWMQDLMNRLQDFGLFSYGKLAVDGVYGPATAGAVSAVEFAVNARYKGDGTVDAEMLSILGNQVLRFQDDLPSGSAGGWQRYYAWPKAGIANTEISNKGNTVAYRVRTWFTGGPWSIDATFGVKLAKNYDIHEIRVIPSMPWGTNFLTISGLDVKTISTDIDTSLRNYNHANQRLKLWQTAYDAETYKIPVGPWNGNAFYVTLTNQGGGSGFGTSKQIGIHNVAALAKSTTGGEVTKHTRTIQLVYTKTVEVTTGRPVTFYARPDQVNTGTGTLSDIKWTSVESSDPDVFVRREDERGKVTALHNEMETTLSDVRITRGPHLPVNSALQDALDNLGGGILLNRYNYKAMNEDKVFFPGEEMGFIKKTDGIKLLTHPTTDSSNANYKKPYGFPSMPTDTGAREFQRHFTTLSLDRFGTDASVTVGFYDIKEREFITNVNGEPSMSYLEYVRRGPENIYIGLVSTYEVEEQRNYPEVTDSPPLPFRFAMPVYGVCGRRASRIGIEPLPPNLGPTDMWALPIRTGEFTRTVAIRRRTAAPLTGWVRDYEGTRVKAYYSVPEAELGGWSKIHGRPYYDVRDETPKIVSSTLIRVTQPPILLREEPTNFKTISDPLRPVIKVYVRATPESPWSQLPFDAIKDYNSSTGDIYLKAPLASTDPQLVKVDYTTSRPTYNFKQFGGNRLSLNPYPGHNRDLVGKPIYIYILPAYVKDEDGDVISASVQERTLRFTTDRTIFDLIDPDYDPLAVLLGIVHITRALDINDLVMLDTRRRGGGARDTISDTEIARLIEDSTSFWDVGFSAGMSYQSGGFVIIRLPRELRLMFPDDEEIIAAIERNITAGVRYKIEDLEGNDWR